MGHYLGENTRRGVLQPNHFPNFLLCVEKDVERGCSAQESVRDEVGRLGKESSIFHLSWDLLDSRWILFGQPDTLLFRLQITENAAAPNA